MRTLVTIVLTLAACGGSPTSPTGGDDTTPDADPGMQPSTCSNYTPPALPDSKLVWRDAAAGAAIDALTHFSVSGSMSTNTAGKVTRFTHDEAGTVNDFTVDFTWDSSGRLVRRSYDGAGTTNDVTDQFTYTSAGKLARWEHDASGTTDDVTDQLTYASAGKLARWEHDASGTTNDVTEQFTYTSHNSIARFEHDASGTTDDLTEQFTYDSDERLVRWTLDHGSQHLDSQFQYGACTH